MRVLKIVKQIQTNVRQNDRKKKKNKIFILFRLVWAVDVCLQPQLLVFGIV
jgi:hypothetical protein